jgi:hypothetical protein
MGKVAKEKVWVAVDGTTLVPDGDEMAAQLVALKGNPLSEQQLSQYENADDFFEDTEAKPDKKSSKEKDNPLNGDDDLKAAEEHHKKHK